MRRLLLLACSQQKRPDAGTLPAVERYDGPAYKVLRRYMRTYPQRMPDVYILSAEFGLIRGDAPIPPYDRRMTERRARELRDQVISVLRVLDIGQRYELIFLCAGAMYRRTLPQDVVSLPSECLTLATGSPGAQLAQLKRWLYQHPEPSPALQAVFREATTPLRFKLRGRDFQITPDEALAAARSGVQNGVAEAVRATAWYVPVDGHRIAPKWLVSQLTGKPVGEFHSEEARRVLHQLGMQVRQA
ncbi:MAG TPA: hypothetical protein VFA70_11300 [Dehalococcoidia bacterium]|nr:hypothetical protein [Dehalococcoidia bacterium]